MGERINHPWPEVRIHSFIHSFTLINFWVNIFLSLPDWPCLERFRLEVVWENWWACLWLKCDSIGEIRGKNNFCPKTKSTFPCWWIHSWSDIALVKNDVNWKLACLIFSHCSHTILLTIFLCFRFMKKKWQRGWDFMNFSKFCVFWDISLSSKVVNIWF